MLATHVRELLSPYLDDELGGRERERVQRHLEVCPECREHLASLRRTLGLVRSLDPVRAPDGFQARVRTHLESTAASSRTPRSRFRLSWQVALSAAAILIIGIFSVNLLREMRPAAQVAAPGRGGVNLAVPPAGELRAPAPVPPASQRSTTGPLIDVRKIVRTAELALEVDKF
ncbi:MAG TPA: anti-sigma factor, partial [bacterium]